MRITEADFASLRPVRTYDEACYPVGRPAGEPEPWRDRSWMGVITRHGRKGLAAAAILAATSACQGGFWPSFPIDETQGRQIIIERFQAEGVTFEQDYHYLSGEVEFEADGFNAALGIGFEYLSEEDNPYYAGTEEDLNWDERHDLDQEMAAGGDAIGQFDYSEIETEIGSIDDEEAARAALEAQVTEFIDFLRSSGRL